MASWVFLWANKYRNAFKWAWKVTAYILWILGLYGSSIRKAGSKTRYITWRKKGTTKDSALKIRESKSVWKKVYIRNILAKKPLWPLPPLKVQCQSIASHKWYHPLSSWVQSKSQEMSSHSHMQNTYILATFVQNQMIFLSTLQQDGMSNSKKMKRDFIQVIINCIYIKCEQSTYLDFNLPPCTDYFQ